MNTAPTYIENHSRLVEVFGYWPQFHDSPVISLNSTDEHIDLVLHVWEMTSEVDSEGYFILRKHHLVHFRFSELSDVKLKDPEIGNILHELSFSELEDFQKSRRFQVRLESVMDLDSSFTAKHGTILDISPCDTRGSRIESGPMQAT